MQIIVLMQDGTRFLFEPDEQYKNVINIEIADGKTWELYKTWFNAHSISDVGDYLREHPELKTNFDEIFLGCKPN